jgi:protein gp37
MGEFTKIEWTDHTFNPWVGCQAISPACDHCYAEAWAKRAGRDFSTPQRTTAANWRDPIKWNGREFFQCNACGARGYGVPYEDFAPSGGSLDHGTECASCGSRDMELVRARVFCASLADIFDNRVPDEWRRDLWALIRSTPNLDWLIVTKRIGNAARMLPEDWGAGYPNVWLLATVSSQPEADRDIPKLLQVPAVVHGLSMEPLLGPVNLATIHRQALNDDWAYIDNALTGFRATKCGGMDGPRLDWIIVGGESGPNARPMQGDWARALRDQCQAVGVPFLFKQWGEWADADNAPQEALDGLWNAHKGKDDLERRGLIQDVPQKPSGPPHFGCNYTVRIGKKAAGRLLDGRTWDEFPNSST